MNNESGMSRKVFLNHLLAGSAGFAAKDLFFDYRAAWCEEPETPGKLELVRTQTTGMSVIRGLAYDREGRLYVAGSEGVRVFERNGDAGPHFQVKGLIAAIAVDEDGDIHLAQPKHVQHLSGAGEVRSVWGEAGSERGQFGRLTGIACSGGMLFLADAGNRRIARVAVNGDPVDEIEGFHIPSAYFGLGLDGEGILHAGHTSKHRVERFDRNLELAGYWGEYGSRPGQFCGCCNPTHLAVFPDGRVATTEKGIPRLKVYSPDGGLVAYLNPSQLGLAPDAALMRRLDESPDGALPCHDGWPGMPLAVSSENLLAVALPGAGEVRIHRLDS